MNQLKEFDFHIGQEAVLNDLHRFRVLNCGRKWGKTTLASIEIPAKATSKDDMRVLYLAPTIGEARDLIWNELNRICRAIIIKANQSPSMELTVRTKDGGSSLIQIRGWEAVENLRGLQFDLIVLDEVAKFKGFWTSWNDVLRPTLTPRRGDALFISTPRGIMTHYDAKSKKTGGRLLAYCY